MINERSAPQEATWQKLLRWTFYIATTWFVLCIFVFISAALVSIPDFIDLPTWLPLPWSGLSSFVETADGKVFAILKLYKRVVCLEHDGTFVGTYHFSELLGGRGRIMSAKLAAARDGRLFLKSSRQLTVLNSSLQLRKTYKEKSHLEENWVVDELGVQVFVPAKGTDQEAVDRLAEPGDVIFSRGRPGRFERPRPRSQFTCADGTVLVRKLDHLERYSADGIHLASYGAPFILRPFALPFPLLLSFPCFLLLGVFLKLLKQR